MSMWPQRRYWLSLGCCFLLAGCAATASRVAVPYVVELQALSEVNPGADGEASPIQLTVYELASTGRFQSTGYFELQNDASQTLGDELLATSRMILKPGETQTVSRPGNVEAKALGIVAGYRNLDTSRWRLVLELPASKNTNVYKFWQFSPGQKRIRIEAGRDSLKAVAGK